MKRILGQLARRTGTAIAASLGTLLAVSPAMQHNIEVIAVAAAALAADLVAEKFFGGN